MIFSNKKTCCSSKFVFSDALATGIRKLKKMADTLDRHRIDLLNYFKHKITNGPAEGVNNKIKTMKRQAYGFRNMDYFKLRLYHLHNQSYRMHQKILELFRCKIRTLK